MPRKLNHLNALHAFEASARLKSFTRAAEELGVTPAAVGQQVRILEDYTGCVLFYRSHKGLKPTPVALRALGEIQRGFENLEFGFNQLIGTMRENQLTLSVAPALANRWLAPRLHSLYDRCPHIDLRMETSLKRADIESGEFDMAIRYGAEEENGLETILLFEEHILPVCAPSLYDKNGASITKRTISNLPLLHIEGETSDRGALSWQEWSRQNGVYSESFAQGPRYPQSALALQAVLNGQGVVLCGLILVIDDLITGKLIAPLGIESSSKAEFAYRLVHSPTQQQSELHKTFTRWITTEARNTNKTMSEYMS